MLPSTQCTVLAGPQNNREMMMGGLGSTEAGNDALLDLARHLGSGQVAVDWRQEDVSRIEKALEVKGPAWVESAVGANRDSIRGGMPITQALEIHHRGGGR